MVISTQVLKNDYFREALFSILGQTHTDFEVVIIFDGCTREHALDALSAFNDPRIRPIVSATNRGLARSLNLAIRISRGKYIARMDDDDRSLPLRLERQLASMELNRFDVLGTQAHVIDATGHRQPGKFLNCNPKAALSPMSAVFDNIFIHPSVMMNRGWALKNRYDSNWGRGQDRELWVRAASHSHYGCLEEPLLEYRRPQQSKPIQLQNVRSAYYLIWRNRRDFRAWVPILIWMNVMRHALYFARSVLAKR